MVENAGRGYGHAAAGHCASHEHGDYADVQALAAQIGDDALRDALAHAEAGQFSKRSWACWHYRLGMAALDEVPDIPVRRFG